MGHRAGEYEIPILPVDYAILELLPDEGTMLGMYTPLAKRVKAILPKLDGMTSAQANGRLTSLHRLGLVTPVIVQPVNSGLGWQRTPAGRRLIEGGTE
jgi:hypothetical protein